MMIPHHHRESHAAAARNWAPLCCLPPTQDLAVQRKKLYQNYRPIVQNTNNILTPISGQLNVVAQRTLRGDDY